MSNQLSAIRRELATANQILANEGVIDAFGHISVRHPDDPNRYLIARHLAAELVEPPDILEFTLDSEPVKPTNERLYSELAIHGCIYQARPDVQSVCHHHAMAVLPYCVTDVELVPLVPLGASAGEKVPIWDSRDEFGDTRVLVTTPDEGRSLARALGPFWMVLMRHHGATVAGRTLHETVFRSIYTCMNAELQTRAMAMGSIGPLSIGEAEQCMSYILSPRPIERAWEYWCRRLTNVRSSATERSARSPVRRSANAKASKRKVRHNDATRFQKRGARRGRRK